MVAYETTHKNLAQLLACNFMEKLFLSPLRELKSVGIHKQPILHQVVNL